MRLLALLLLALVSRQAHAAEPRSCQVNQKHAANLAIAHLKQGGRFVTWCDSCQKPPQPSRPAPVRTAELRAHGDSWEVVLNGKPAELRDTFVAFPDGSFRRMASLVGCEVWTAENEGGPFDNGNQRAERLKPQPASAVDFCDVSVPLVPRLLGLRPDRDPELKVPVWLGLVRLQNHAVGTFADLASPDGRFELHFSFEDDIFTKRPTEEGPETSGPCKGASCVRISRRYTLPLQDVSLTVELPPEELERCRPQVDRLFAMMRSLL